MPLTMIFIVFVTWLFIGSFLFRKLKMKKGCGTMFLLIIVAIGGTFGTQKILGWYNQWQIARQEYIAKERAKETQRAVMAFLAEMNPPLGSKFREINQEIALIDNKIQQLMDLKTDFPNQSLIVDKTLHKWQTLKLELNQVSQDIYQQVEKAYVAYRIDEIQGRQKFGVLSEELLKEANVALANAEVTKTTIEEQLSE